MKFQLQSQMQIAWWYIWIEWMILQIVVVIYSNSDSDSDSFP